VEKGQVNGLGTVNGESLRRRKRFARRPTSASTAARLGCANVDPKIADETAVTQRGAKQLASSWLFTGSELSASDLVGWEAAAKSQRLRPCDLGSSPVNTSGTLTRSICFLRP